MKRLLAVALTVFLASPALAASIGVNGYEAQLSGLTDLRVQRNGDSDWKGLIGAGVAVAPEFLGSQDYEPAALPLFDVEWRNAYFLSTQRGLGLSFIRRQNFKFGPRLTYDQGRDSSNSTFLIRLPDVDPSLEFGAFLEWINGNFRLKSDFRKGLGTTGHDAYVASLDGAFAGRIADNASVVLGGFTHYVTSKYMQKYFDVSVAATGRPVFRTSGGGVPDLGVYLNLVYDFSENIFASLLTRGAVLLGDAASSPISQQDLQYSAGLSVGYRF